MITVNNVRKQVEKHLEGTDKFLVEVLVKPGNKVLVFIDGDTFVTIDDCVALSRFVEDYLETTGEEFELNVSSAGADQPFSLTRQYKKYIGKDITVLLHDDKKMTGQLLSLKEDGIDFLPQVKKIKKGEEQHTSPIFILFQEIKEAKPLISFK